MVPERLSCCPLSCCPRMLSKHADARAYLFDFVHANGGKPSGYSYATLRVDSFPSITQWFVYIYTGLVCASWYQTSKMECGFVADGDPADASLESAAKRIEHKCWSHDGKCKLCPIKADLQSASRQCTWDICFLVLGI